MQTGDRKQNLLLGVDGANDHKGQEETSERAGGRGGVKEMTVLLIVRLISTA